MKGLSRRRWMGREVPERVDLLVIIPILIGFYCLMWFQIWVDKTPDLAQKAGFLSSCLFMGLAMRAGAAMFFGHRLRMTVDLSLGRIGFTVLCVGLLVMSLGVVYRYALLPHFGPEFPSAVQVSVKQAFYTLAAVAEEVFWIWGVFLPAMILFDRVSIFGLPGWITALATSSVMFVAFHLAVYQTRPDLMLMFLYRASFNFSYLMGGWWFSERNMAIPLWTHMVINFTAAMSAT